MEDSFLAPVAAVARKQATAAPPCYNGEQKESAPHNGKRPSD